MPSARKLGEFPSLLYPASSFNAGINTLFFYQGGREPKESERGRGGGGADTSLARLLRIAIEGPELGDVNFEDIFEVIKEKT